MIGMRLGHLGLLLLLGCPNAPTPVVVFDSDPANAGIDDVEMIFSQYCSNSGCHGGAVYPDLAWDIHPDLVSAPSQQSWLPLVSPFAPGDSYLWAKLTDGHLDLAGSGTMMPPRGNPQLNGEQLAVIRTWIARGARDD